MPNIGSVVLGVSDMARARAFWTAALDYTPREPGTDRWTVLVPTHGPGVQVALGLSGVPAQEHPRVHLDLYAENTADQAAEVDRLLALGAERVDWDLYPEDPDFVVLADPEGNRFCVIDPTHPQAPPGDAPGTSAPGGRPPSRSPRPHSEGTAPTPGRAG
ncbi:VOC family protein [Nocardiopsis flavescens]|uniref:VOC family protein n=1 Tax=Nocardiopsis flavescens TaxID=758803 RepID=UPI0036604A27